MIRSPATLALVALVAVAAACRGTGQPAAEGAEPTIDTPSSAPRVVQPGAPGEMTEVITAEEAEVPPAPHSEADVAFMRGMIHHHAQAIAMAALVPERTDNRNVLLLARRIDLSQVSEIRLMQDWLRARGESAPEPMVEHMSHMIGDEREFMPGMLTAREMAALEAAEGPAFDRLFLEGMIKHHGGALTMVRELFASPSAALDDELFVFASHVEADQAIEIRRMRALLR